MLCTTPTTGDSAIRRVHFELGCGNFGPGMRNCQQRRPPARNGSSWVWKATTSVEFYLFSIHFAPSSGQGRGECFTNLYSHDAPRANKKSLRVAEGKRAVGVGLRRQRYWLHAATLGQCHPVLRAGNGEQNRR